MYTKPAWKWINLAVFICMVVVNALAELLPIGGATTGTISALYPSPLTPVPISFSIWGLIYLYLAVFLLIQLAFKSVNSATESISFWFVFSCAANIGWILAWHFQMMSLAVLMMTILLITLAVMESKLKDFRENAAQRWLIRAPFSIYYGWITVAAIANISVWLSAIGFAGFGLPSAFWQTVVLLVGGVILCAGIWVNHDVPYGFAGIWAYLGILMRQLSFEMSAQMSIWPVAAILVSIIAMLYVMLVATFSCSAPQIPFLRRFMSHPPEVKNKAI